MKKESCSFSASPASGWLRDGLDKAPDRGGVSVSNSAAKYKNSEPGSYPIEVEDKSPFPHSRFTMNIADLIADVNIPFKSILSDDVLQHLIEKRPEGGVYTEKVLFSLSDADDQQMVERGDMDAANTKKDPAD